MSLYLKLAFATGVPFGALMAALALVAVVVGGKAREAPNAVAICFVAGAAFGVFMSATLGTMQLRSERAARRHSQSRSGRVRLVASARGRGVCASYTQTLAVDLPPAQAYEHCVGAAEAFEWAKLRRADAAARAVTLQLVQSWKSRGECVEIRLRTADDGSTLIEVTSRSAVRIAIADSGKNADNVRSLFDWFDRTLPRRASRV